MECSRSIKKYGLNFIKFGEIGGLWTNSIVDYIWSNLSLS